MKYFSIRSRRDGGVIFKGRFRDFRNCLRRAVEKGVTLAHADLRHKNLTNAMLDDAHLPGADFQGSNLTGANLSEADLKGARFTNADLYNACFVGADLRGCRFDGAAFGGTDITNADISHAVFSTLSCFSLDFTHARAMTGCVFINPDGRVAGMSRPPVVIKGLAAQPLIIMDRRIKFGPSFIDRAEAIAFSRKPKEAAG